MSLEVIPVGEVYEAIIRKRGFDPAALTFDATERSNLSELVNRAIKRAWESQFWEPLMVVEARRYREDWDTLLNYAEGDEVWYANTGDGAYYLSKVDGNVAQDPELDTVEAFWGPVSSDFVANIDLRGLEGADIGAIDVRKHVFHVDPRVYPGNAPVTGCSMSGESIIVRGSSIPSQPWIKYRLPTRRFTWVAWDIAVAYAVGDRVYVETSGSDSVRESFVAIESSTAADPFTNLDKWEVVEFPLFIRDYVVASVSSMEMAEDEGRYRARAEASEELDWLHDRYGDQVGAPRKARFKVGR